MRLVPLAFLILPLSAANAPEPPKLRLDGIAKPLRYAVDLTLAPNQDSFHGIVDIDLRFSQPESILWLNAADLTISDAALLSGGRSIPAKVVTGGDQFTGFDFGQPVSGEARLHVVYEGKINRNSSAGVFQLKQGDDWYVYTQFEPTDARRAFPCFDEPSYKTPWQLSLHVPRQFRAFANYPLESETDEPAGSKVVKFAETKPLPSYLVAFAVGPFDIVDAGKAGKTPLRIIVPRGKSGDAKYAADAIPQLLNLLEHYFGVPFAYPKLDSIVMPISNFAMENVGLITYGESLLLSNPANDTLNRQRGCASVAAHEMAHQWFGDLVTTAWWNDIWLNEAFATWMASKILTEWKPEWHQDVSTVNDRLYAMQLDSLISARKIRQPIQNNDDIANAFDDITYEKGAAVLNMFESWMGADRFRKGVQIYIKAHANGNATTDEFTAAESSAAGKDITPAFNSFLDQAGVPLVSVALDCGQKKPLLRMTQKRALPIGSPGAAPQTWMIPVCVRYPEGDGSRRECYLFSDPNSEMTLRSARSCPAWILPNDGEKGYYRVEYLGDLLQKVLADRGSELTVSERVGVLGDVQAGVKIGSVTPQAALKLVPEFANDPDRHLTESALNIAGILDSNLAPESLRPRAEKFIRDNFGKRAEGLGWKPAPGESEDRRLLREDLVGAVASEGNDRELIGHASELARRWLEDHAAVSSDMLHSVLHVAAEFGNRELFDKLHAAAKAEKNQRVRETILGAMGSFRDPAIARAAPDLLLADEFDVREAFYAFLFGPLQYPETKYLPFEFVRANLDKLLARLPREVGGDFAASLTTVGRPFCDATHRDEFESFFSDKVKNYTGGPRNLAQTIETINLCIAQKQVLGPQLEAFLRSY